MINKDNESLQITLKKSDIQKLKLINTALNSKFNLELSKSQVIQHLIKSFEIEIKPNQKIDIKPIKTTQKEPNIKTAHTIQESNQQRKEQSDKLKIESKRKLTELKTLLNLSIKDFSELLNIKFETMRDYLKGRRTPTGENEKIINKYYQKYGII